MIQTAKYVCPHCGSDEGVHANGIVDEMQNVTIQYVYDADGDLSEYGREYGDSEITNEEIENATCDNCGKEVEKAITREEYDEQNADEAEEESEEALIAEPKKDDYEPEKRDGFFCERNCDTENVKWHLKTENEPGGSKPGWNWLCDEHYNALPGATNELATEENVQRIRWFKENGETIEEKPHTVTTTEANEKVGLGFISVQTKTPTNVNGYLFYCKGAKGERNVLATQYAKMFAVAKKDDDFEIKGNALLVEKREDE